MNHPTTTVLLALWMAVLAPAQDSPTPAADVLVQVELIELPHESVTKLMRDEALATDATALRVRLQDLIRKHEAAIMETVMLRTKDGATGSATSHREWIYPTEYWPIELPHSVGLIGRKAKNKPRSPELPPVPSAFETRNVGLSLSARPTANADRSVVSLSLDLTLTRHLRTIPWAKRKSPSGNEFAWSMPEFECLRMPVRLDVPDGRYGLAGLLRRADKADRRIMVFVRCDLLDVSGKG